jgi:hypothetical protein
VLDLAKIKVSRKFRTPDCELYALTTEVKMGAQRISTDYTGKRVEERMDYKVGELVVVYGCD